MAISKDVEHVVYSVNFPNGKRYIGITSKTVEERITQHFSSSEKEDYKFHRALRKYPPQQLSVEVIGYCMNGAEAAAVEKAYIEHFDSKKNGYNSTDGGEGCCGIEYNEASRSNISFAQKKRFENPEERKKTSAALRKWREENPDKYADIEKIRFGVMSTPEHKEMMSKKMTEYYENNPDKIKQSTETLVKRYSESYDIQARISRTLGGCPIEAISNGEVESVYYSTADAARCLNINKGNLQSVLDGKRNHVEGYTFRRVKCEN